MSKNHASATYLRDKPPTSDKNTNHEPLLLARLLRNEMPYTKVHLQVGISLLAIVVPTDILPGFASATALKVAMVGSVAIAIGSLAKKKTLRVVAC